MGTAVREQGMKVDENSLRKQVEKWLAPTPAMPAQVIQFSRSPANNRRYVCVQVARPTFSLAIFFFRHDDGAWRVFPPSSEGPAMNYRQAA
jgi:hypothetical protein